MLTPRVLDRMLIGTVLGMAGCVVGLLAGLAPVLLNGGLMVGAPLLVIGAALRLLQASASSSHMPSS